MLGGFAELRAMQVLIKLKRFLPLFRASPLFSLPSSFTCNYSPLHSIDSTTRNSSTFIFISKSIRIQSWV